MFCKMCARQSDRCSSWLRLRANAWVIDERWILLLDVVVVDDVLLALVASVCDKDARVDSAQRSRNRQDSGNYSTFILFRNVDVIIILKWDAHSSRKQSAVSDGSSDSPPACLRHSTTKRDWSAMRTRSLRASVSTIVQCCNSFHVFVVLIDRLFDWLVSFDYWFVRWFSGCCCAMCVVAARLRRRAQSSESPIQCIFVGSWKNK